MTKDEQEHLLEEIQGVLKRVRFVSNNIDSRDKHKDVCGQLEVIASRLRELCEAFTSDETEN
jgi:hypothetical protein